MSDAPRPVPDAALLPRARDAQRRAVRVLGAAQVFSGLGNGATLSLGSILAVDLSGAESSAGLANTAMTLGSAAVSIPLAGVAARRGRRVALGFGLAAGLLGQGLMVAAVVTRSFPLLLLGAFLVGFAAAVNLQARFAVTDLSDPQHRGRDLSVVVWAVTVGAVLGPNMVGPGAVLAGWLGINAHAGPFLISAAGMAVGAAIILAGLRPDPLLLRRELEGATPGAAPGTDGPGPTSAGHPGVTVPPRGARAGSWAAGWRVVRARPTALAAVLAVAGAHAAMVGLMSMTPLHLQHEAGVAGHELGMHPDTVVLIGFTISLHVAGMYALSPVMGLLSDRHGPARVASAGLAMLLMAAVLTGLFPHVHAAVVAGLVVLGLGWSAATVAGSTLLVAALSPDERVPAQGFSDAVMSLAGAVGSLAAGPLMGAVGFAGLSAALGVMVILCGFGAAALLRAPAAVPPRG
ncbi:MFS transporter [Citricoccus sp. I39-566]|uniref:MFS transporter n=1 Tax=Citricoccus sp. I39-566 TaxID=3073268 RepID=UPI00286CCAA1|nr:MFS transporter [Citricoccus sp. I39-566]WMY77904.1 MFS transporter [Citricoccus sp. I39-566]